MRTALLALLILGALALGLGAIAHAGETGGWTTYRHGGRTITIRTACFAAEDSAAHPRLIAYSDHGRTITLGCQRGGY